MNETQTQLEQALRESNVNPSQAIHDAWNAREQTRAADDPAFYVTLGRRADRLGQVMFAYDILREGRFRFPQELRLTQLYALSAIKCGYVNDARELLTALVRAGNVDEETLGILGRVYKEIWVITGNDRSNDPLLRKARNLYLRAFLRHGGYYSGINAASLSALLGEWVTSEKVARNVLRICAQERSQEGNDADRWLLATVGEASALIGNRDESLRAYAAARKAAAGNLSDLASMRRQLKLLRRVTPVAEEALEEIRVPPVVAFSGHMLDLPGRRTPRFPPERAEAVKRKIVEALAETEAQIGYCSAAGGGDVLFLEAMHERGGETNVILPFDRNEFFQTSVNTAGEPWRRRTEQVLSQATSVDEVVKSRYRGDDLLFTYANRLIAGKALLRARTLDTSAMLLAVWDGIASKETGGTAEMVALWSHTSELRRIISVGTGRRERRAPRLGGRKPAGDGVVSRKMRLRREVISILFADLVGYSRLTEDQIPYFLDAFLGGLSSRLRATGERPIFRNVWGDALYFAFRSPHAAVEYALALRDFVRNSDWRAMRLPDAMSMRIGLHAGPVFSGREPVLGRTNFFGTHVNHAARIEPITSPGNVYASEEFVALLSVEKPGNLDYRYVGVIRLPKDFGNYPIYHIKRRTEIE